MAQRTKVLLLIPHLGGGGAEQVTVLLARGLSRAKYEVHLGIVTEQGAEHSSAGHSGAAHSGAAKGHLPPELNLHVLGAPRVRAGALQLLRLVRRLKPDVILSGMAHLNFLVLLLRPLFPRGTRVLVRQNGTVSSALAFGGLPKSTRLLYRVLYRHADRVLCQTRAMAKDLAEQVRIDEAQLAVLPNPVDIDAIRAAADEAQKQGAGLTPCGPGPHLLAVGRLTREKGFDLLLQALAVVRERFPEADLTIAGTGREDAALKAECRQLRLEAAVRFTGHVDCPATYFPGASLFVLSSRHEGLPNAMLEAAAGGLPIVALPASGGVVDLLLGQPGVGVAAEISAASLASSLLATLEAVRPGERFPHAFVEQFRMKRAIHAYEELIDSVLEERAR
jgi:glycosyltransferase involved in cell wall biosynthesis